MFSNLRAGSQIYILYKDSTPRVETGTVTGITQPVPKFPVTNYMAPQEYVLDMTVKVGSDDLMLQKLPASADVADQGINGNMVIATTREVMNGEVTALRTKSAAVIDSVDYHRKVVQDCDALLQRLNPEYAEQRQQKADIDELKAQVSMMAGYIKELTTQLKNKDNG